MKKNHTKKIFATILASSMLLLAACGAKSSTAPASGSAAEASEKPVNIIWSNYGSSAMPQATADNAAIEYIQANSNITIDYQPDAVLGGESDTMQQLMDGTIQCASVATPAFSVYTNLIDTLQLPFLIGDYETEYKVLKSAEMQDIFEKVGSDLGLKIIGIGENGMRHLANNKRPVTDLESLKGLKLRTAPSNMLESVMNNLGSSPVSVPYSEVYSALQNNVVDGEEINITSAYAMNHYEVLKYISEIGLYPFPEVIVMNLDFWNSLSAEQQQVINTAMDKSAEDLFTKYLPEYEAAAIKVCQEAGVQFNSIEGAARNEFVKIAMSTWDEYAEKDPRIAALINSIKTMG